jgi:tryptophanase
VKIRDKALSAKLVWSRGWALSTSQHVLHDHAELELVRLTFPRRVYTQAHCDVTVESIESVHDNRENVRGLKMVHEPRYLRFFQARFERL